MKPAPFKYFAPRDFGEAVQLMGQYAEDARPLAGGQSLVALMNTRLLQPAVIIDLGRCADVDGILEAEQGVALLSMARQGVAEHSPLVAASCPLVAAALPYVGSASHRNRGTVCGSLAHADPVAELPCVAVALDAEFNIAGVSGRRSVPATEFFFGPLSTALEPHELLESVTFPKSSTRAKAAFLEVGRNRLHGFALVGVGAQIDFDINGMCDTVCIAAMGVGDVPIKMHELEAALKGQFLSVRVIDELVSDHTMDFEVRSDIHASAEYRRAIVGTLVKRALTNIEKQRYHA